MGSGLCSAYPGEVQRGGRGRDRGRGRQGRPGGVGPLLLAAPACLCICLCLLFVLLCEADLNFRVLWRGLWGFLWRLLMAGGLSVTVPDDWHCRGVWLCKGCLALSHYLRSASLPLTPGLSHYLGTEQGYLVSLRARISLPLGYCTCFRARPPERACLADEVQHGQPCRGQRLTERRWYKPCKACVSHTPLNPLTLLCPLSVPSLSSTSSLCLSLCMLPPAPSSCVRNGVGSERVW